MSDDLIFEDPLVTRGPGSRGQTPVGLWLASLRAHPGRWARYHDPVNVGRAAGIRSGKYGTTVGEFEAATRRSDSEGKVWLYARYLGGAS